MLKPLQDLADPAAATARERQVLPRLLLPEEPVVWSGMLMSRGIGLLVATDRRFLFVQCGVIRQSPRVISIPYRQIFEIRDVDRFNFPALEIVWAGGAVTTFTGLAQEAATLWKVLVDRLAGESHDVAPAIHGDERRSRSLRAVAIAIASAVLGIYGTVPRSVGLVLAAIALSYAIGVAIRPLRD